MIAELQILGCVTYMFAFLPVIGLKDALILIVVLKYFTWQETPHFYVSDQET